MDIRSHTIFISILAGFAFFISGCRQPPAESVPAVPDMPTASAAPVATVELEPTPDAVQAAGIIIDALLALNTTPNRMETVTTPEGGAADTSVIEFLPPDRKRIVSLSQQVEYIIVSETVYFLNPENQEWETTAIPATVFMGDAPVTAESLAQTVQDAEFLRTEELNGQAMLVFGYMSTTATQGVVLNSRTELWIGLQDGLPYRMVIDGEVLAASTDPDSGENQVSAVPAHTETAIEFDDSIVIAAPLP